MSASAGGGMLADDRFSNSEKATLGLAATGGSVQVTTELINRLSGTPTSAHLHLKSACLSTKMLESFIR